MDTTTLSPDIYSTTKSPDIYSTSLQPIINTKPKCNFEGKYYANKDDLVLIHKFPTWNVVFLILGCLGFILFFYIPEPTFDTRGETGPFNPLIVLLIGSATAIVVCSININKYRKTLNKVKKEGTDCLP